MTAEKQDDYSRFIDGIKGVIEQARLLSVRSVNTLQVTSNYLIGQLIVEFEQSGRERAEYGKKVLELLSAQLSADFGRGYSRTNLEYMRKFYLMCQEKGISQRVSGELEVPSDTEKSQTVSGVLTSTQNSSVDVRRIWQTLSAEFPLSWSHYVFLMSVKAGEERAFYEKEAANEGGGRCGN